MSDTSVQTRGRLAALGAYGFEAQEAIILAALASGDPILLIGRSGTGKTFLLNSISEALGLEHRHYNASLISFDDLVGFPYPDEAKASVRFLETPATVWGAESVLMRWVHPRPGAGAASLMRPLGPSSRVRCPSYRSALPEGRTGG